MVQAGHSKPTGAAAEETLPARDARNLNPTDTVGDWDVLKDGLKDWVEPPKDDHMSPIAAAALAHSNGAAATQSALLAMSQQEQHDLLNYSG